MKLTGVSLAGAVLMKCLDDNKATELLEGLLPAAEVSRLEEHIADCQECRQLMAALADASLVQMAEASPGEGTSTTPGSALPQDTPFTDLASPSLTPRTMVDHFRVLRLLARGGMGEVYLARDCRLGRRVALKFIRPGALGDREAMQRFLFEARTTARFSHPHMVTVYAVGEYRQMPYLALEYLEGQTLRQRMDTERPGFQETVRMGLAIAEALQEAHRNGVLHRDLKPSNVMVGRDGRLRVLDFGLAKILHPQPCGNTGPPLKVRMVKGTRWGARSRPGP